MLTSPVQAVLWDSLQQEDKGRQAKLLTSPLAVARRGRYFNGTSGLCRSGTDIFCPGHLKSSLSFGWGRVKGLLQGGPSKQWVTKIINKSYCMLSLMASPRSCSKTLLLWGLHTSSVLQLEFIHSLFRPSRCHMSCCDAECCLLTNVNLRLFKGKQCSVKDFSPAISVGAYLCRCSNFYLSLFSLIWFRSLSVHLCVFLNNTYTWQKTPCLFQLFCPEKQALPTRKQWILWTSESSVSHQENYIYQSSNAMVFWKH